VQLGPTSLQTKQNMRFAYLAICFYLTSCSSNTEVVEKFADGKPKKVIEHHDNDSTCEKSYHENGKLERVKCFKNGKQTGEQVYFRKDGTKAAIMTFSNGIRHGQTFEYHPSGQIAFEGIVENGEFEGVSKWYFKNGKLNFIGNRHLGKDTGWWYYFNMQGDTIRKKYKKTGDDIPTYFDGKGKRITSDDWENITREE
jgi:antitoxin component YwqK of YwqJK toxin-antitoxin module